jgi:hypothetical protein
MLTMAKVSRFLLFCLFILIVLSLGVFSCNNEPVVEESDPEIDRELEGSLDEEIKSELPPVSEFSILSGGKKISLTDWVDQAELKELFGEPTYEDIEVLGSGADTFEGSFVKTVIYEGLEIKLFSPPDDGENYWVTEIKIESKRYPTPRGIRVGDPLEVVMEVYPELKKLDENQRGQEYYAYEFLVEEEYSYIHFKTVEGLIDQIDIFYLIP